jgi:hypothetical protein
MEHTDDVVITGVDKKIPVAKTVCFVHQKETDVLTEKMLDVYAQMLNRYNKLNGKL